MNSSLSKCPDDIFKGLGIARYAVATAEPIEASHLSAYREWIAAGNHGSMDYLARHEALRADARLLLPGARAVISCALPYPSPCHSAGERPCISMYALGSDYHEIMRQKLLTAAQRLSEAMGGETRVCVDTTPILERYWAAKSGLGFIGMNHHLIIPGLGSCFFLGEILTTLPLRPDNPLETTCGSCGKCITSCPGGALGADGTFDARRCLSYLTIEHRGPVPPGTNLHGCLYGCDICAAVCPHNQDAEQLPIDPKLQPRSAVASLTPHRAATLTQEEFSALFSHSAVKRTKLAGLQRNAMILLSAKK